MTKLLTTTTALVLATGIAFAQESTTTDPATDPTAGTAAGSMGSGLSMGMADLSSLPEACRTGAGGMMGGSLSGTTTGASDSAGSATTTDSTAGTTTSDSTTTSDGTSTDTTSSADASPDSTDPAASTDGTGTETATSETTTIEGTGTEGATTDGTAAEGTVGTATDSGTMMAGGMGSAMMTMHSQMMAVQGITDSDLAFACAMIPHHQGAIDMARAMEAQLQDEELQSMAETMISTHQSEIDTLTTWVEEHGASGQ